MLAADRKILDAFAADCTAALGRRLRAVVFLPEAALPSDAMETVVVVESVTPEVLREVSRVAGRWRRKRVGTPLVLDDADLATSRDVFPLELLALTDSHVLVCGEQDPLAGFPIDREHLRLEVEQQLKGKILHLRQAYLEAAGNTRRLTTLLLDSSGGFELILRGLLELAGVPPVAAARMAGEVERVLSVRLDALRQVGDARRRGERTLGGDAEGLFRSYLEELTALAHVADGVTRA